MRVHAQSRQQVITFSFLSGQVVFHFGSHQLFQTYLKNMGNTLAHIHLSTTELSHSLTFKFVAELKSKSKIKMLLFPFPSDAEFGVHCSYEYFCSFTAWVPVTVFGMFSNFIEIDCL
jgi:hypothetical protein